MRLSLILIFMVTGVSPLVGQILSQKYIEVSGFAEKEITADYATAFDFNNLSRVSGRMTYGLLGGEVFFRYVVEIDYASQTVTLHEPKNYIYKGNGKKVPLRFSKDSALPLVSATIEIPGHSKLKGTFLIDTGSNDTLQLYASFVEKNKLLNTKQKLIESQITGVDGDIILFKGVGTNFQLGDFDIARPVVTFTSSEKTSKSPFSYDGVIGNQIWSRFKVIFDYSHKQMILEKGANFDQPFEINLSGLGLVAEGSDFKQIKVISVSPDTPATEAGLKVGDQLITINDKPAKDLYQVRQMFRREGQEYLLKIKRGDEILTIKLKMRNPF